MPEARTQMISTQTDIPAPLHPFGAPEADRDARSLSLDPLTGDHRVVDGWGRRSMPLSEAMLLAVRADPAWMLLISLDAPETAAR